MYAYGLPLNRVAISGSNGPRASLFAPAAKEIFGLGAVAAPAPRRYLGQNFATLNTAQDYYAAAQQVIARYDSLVGRVAKLANKADRDRIISDYGLNEPANKDKSGYMRQALASCVAEVQKYSPLAYEQGFPTHGPCRGRVQKLKDFANDLESEVQTSEMTYGILPEPVVIERLVTGPSAPSSSIVPYVVVGGVAVAALAALGVFG
jgi:hypothetical protein